MDRKPQSDRGPNQPSSVDKDRVNREAGSEGGSRVASTAQRETQHRQGATHSGSQQIDDVGTQHYAADSPDRPPQSPAGPQQVSETDMDDETGLSNSANRQQAVDQHKKQAQQSNVGRRDDMTAD